MVSLIRRAYTYTQLEYFCVHRRLPPSPGGLAPCLYHGLQLGVLRIVLRHIRYLGHIDYRRISSIVFA